MKLFQRMPRYFFNIRDGEPVDDPDGMYLPDTRSARLEAMRSARDIMAEDVRRGRLHLASCIEVTDEQGEPVFVVPFAEAIQIEHA
jgi:hypothetical protein